MPVGAVNAVKKQCSSPAGAKGNLCQTMKRIWGAYLSLVLLAMSSCQQQVEHGGKTPLAQVGDHFLYREDMAQALPYGISGTDSVRFVNEFVQKWLEEQVLYEKAEHNVRGDEKIERMVAEYRRTLVMNNYEHMLLLQRMNEELTEEELQGYYN